MGCFHGLNVEAQGNYARGLAEIIFPGGIFMLYAMAPKKEARMGFGVTPDQVRSIFVPWFDVEKMEQGAFWDRKSTWFWMKRNQAAVEN